MKIIVRDQDGMILMYSMGNPTPGIGETLVELDEAKTEEFLAASQIPNNGVTYQGGAIAAIPRDLYVIRNATGDIKTVLTMNRSGSSPISVDDPELVDFLAAHPGPLGLYLGEAPAPVLASSGDFMSAILDLGWDEDIEAAITALEGANAVLGKRARYLWTRAAAFERYNPLVIQIATAIGKNSDDLDALFTLAGTYASSNGG